MKIYEEVLRKTNSGLEIFIYYLGKECLNKKFKSPFRSDDKRPSCHLYENKNKMVRQPTICKILETVDVAETVLKSQQRF